MRATRVAVDQLEHEQAVFIAALMVADNPVSTDLANRLQRCLDHRKARRRWKTAGLTTVEAVSVGYGYRCRALGCGACRPPITRRAAVAAYHRFLHADNDDVSHVTISLARTTDLAEVRGIAATARRGLRDRRDATARIWGRWRNVEAAGYVEVDAVLPIDIPLLGSDRQALIPSLPFVGAIGDGPHWLPHLHLTAHHPGVDRGELLTVLSEQWPGVNRVHVAPFHTDKTAGENSGIVTEYSLKHFHSTEFADDVVVGWPIAWSALYYTWLHEMRRGLEPLRVRLGPKVDKSPPLFSSVRGDRHLDPMPMLVTDGLSLRVPVHRNWGIAGAGHARPAAVEADRPAGCQDHTAKPGWFGISPSTAHQRDAPIYGK